MSINTPDLKVATTIGCDPVRRLVNPTADGARALANEWIVTNGLGGYASGTLSGILTRRYHGLLVAALPSPVGRMVMLSHVEAQLRLPSGAVVRFDPEPMPLDTHTPSEAEEPPMTLVEFRLDLGLPTWRFEGSRLRGRKACVDGLSAKHRSRHIPCRRGRRPGTA